MWEAGFDKSAQVKSDISSNALSGHCPASDVRMQGLRARYHISSIRQTRSSNSSFGPHHRRRSDRRHNPRHAQLRLVGLCQLFNFDNQQIHPAGKGSLSASFRISHHARMARSLTARCCTNNWVPHLVESHARENIGHTLSSATERRSAL